MLRSHFNRLLEVLQISDVMISRQDKQDGIALAKAFITASLHGTEGCSNNGWRRITAHRLKNDLPVIHAYLMQLFCHEKSMVQITDHKRWLDISETIQATDSILKHALFIDQADELLGAMSPREWP